MAAASAAFQLPTAEIDLGGRRERPYVADGLERHDEVADPLETKQEDALRLAAGAASGERLHDGRCDGQGGIRRSHERALTEVRNLQQDIVVALSRAASSARFRLREGSGETSPKRLRRGGGPFAWLTRCRSFALHEIASKILSAVSPPVRAIRAGRVLTSP